MRVVLQFLFSAAIGLCIQPAVAADEYGKFDGPVVASWNADGRTMTVVNDFTYTDPLGVRWTAKKGAQVDGASVPKWLWPLAGTPFVGKYRDASVVHDVACQQKARPWESVHLAFYYAMLAAGVDTFDAKLMYAGVFLGGPRWPIAIRAVRRNDTFSSIVSEISRSTAARVEAGASDTVSVKTVMRGPIGDAPRVETIFAPTTEKIRSAAANPAIVELLAEFKSPEAPLVTAEQWQRVKAFVESGDRSLAEIRAFRP